MADETQELTEVQAVIAGLSSPTNEQFMQAVRGYSDLAIAMAGAKGGGGAGLPDWWTVDSTPGSEAVEFDGEIAATFNQSQRAAYAGNPVSIPDNPGGSPTALTWDSLGSGAALLDLTDPELPEVITAGIYAVTAVAHAAEVLSVGASYLAVLHLDFMGDDAICEMAANKSTSPGIEEMVSLACTYYIPAGGVISVTVVLDDGTAARDFNLREAMIQRIL